MVPDSGSVDIRLGWGNIDGGGGILGQTTVPSFGALSDVVIILDIDEDWFLNGDAPPENIDFSATVTHEIGHAIGIGHSQKSKALMNATYSRTILDLQNDDKDAAIEIYGENDLTKIETQMFKILDEHSTISRVATPRIEAIQTFADRNESYKVEIIEGTEDQKHFPLYHQGDDANKVISLLFSIP